MDADVRNGSDEMDKFFSGEDYATRVAMFRSHKGLTPAARGHNTRFFRR